MEVKLNLIPEYRKDEINQERKFKFVLKEGMAILAFIILAASVIFSFEYVTRINLNVANDLVESEANKKDLEKLQGYTKSIQDYNSRILDIEKVQNDQLYWSVFLEKVSELIPDGIEIGNLASKNFKITISGKADNRESLIGFKEALEREDCFEKVNLPLSDLVTKSNIEFKVDFLIKETCIKK